MSQFQLWAGCGVVLSMHSGSGCSGEFTVQLSNGPIDDLLPLGTCMTGHRRMTGGKIALSANLLVATSRASTPPSYYFAYRAIPTEPREPGVSLTRTLSTMGKTDYGNKLQTAIQHARREPGVPTTRFAALYGVNVRTLGRRLAGTTTNHAAPSRNKQLFDVGGREINRRACWAHGRCWISVKS